MADIALNKLGEAGTVAASLRAAMEGYHPLSDSTWQAMVELCRYTRVTAGTTVYQCGRRVNSFAFVYSGLLRAYTLDEQGNEYNKIFFPENTFPASTVALLQNAPSSFSLEALEDSQLVLIDYAGYRQLLLASDDLKMFHIHYLEQNWLIAKEPREVSLVMETAAERYQTFLKTHADLVPRLTQYQIASHLGITPTQLSRIRRKPPA